MAMFMTKVWGFPEPCTPLQFSKDFNRDAARKLVAAAPGSLVVLVGTLGPPTPKLLRGRLLGLMRPTTEVVPSLAFGINHRPSDFDEDGNYIWPYALANSAAWRLDERPFLKQFTTRKFGRDSAARIVDFTPEEARVLALAHTHVPLLPMIRSGVAGAAERAKGRGAPPPSTTRAGVMHMRSAFAETYCMLVRRADVLSFKVGWAFDARHRMNGFNLASMPSIGGLSYEGFLTQPWRTARDAFAMERELLALLDAARHPDNREIITGIMRAEMEDAWRKAIQAVRKRRAAMAKAHFEE